MTGPGGDDDDHDEDRDQDERDTRLSTPSKTRKQMTTSSPQHAARLANARALVREVLQGKQTDQSTPGLVADDVLSFQVATVEQGDPAWLEQQLSDPRFTKDLRLQVALQLRGPLRRPLLTALGAPAFVIGRGG